MTTATDTRSAFASANGIEQHYLELGSGHPLIVLNNGMVSTSSVWDGFPMAYGTNLAELARHFRVIAPDLRGSGRTVHRGGPISYALLAEDLIALIAELGLERPAVCGFSDGGLLATIAAIERPELFGAVVNLGGYDLLDPDAPSFAMARQMMGGSPDAEEPNFEAIEALSQQVPELGALFELMRADHDAAQGEGHWRTVIAQTYPRITRHERHTFADLERITAPTLMLVGDRDQFCPVEQGAAAYRALPDGELCVLAGTGHLITPGAIAATIEFCERRLAS